MEGFIIPKDAFLSYVFGIYLLLAKKECLIQDEAHIGLFWG